MWLRCGDAVRFRDAGCASLQSGTGPRAPDSTAIVAVEGRILEDFVSLSKDPQGFVNFLDG
jgi:hypothetical protein